MGATTTLDALPTMGAAFARALIPTRSGRVRIPDGTLEVVGHRQDPDRLAAYVRTCGFTLRDHVPPTWIHVLSFPLHVHLLGDPDSSIRLLGAVHTANRMTLHRPVRLDDPLDLSVRVDNLRPHARGAMVDLVGAARVDGETVWDGVSTYLAPGIDVPGEPEPTVRSPFTPAPPHQLWRLPADLGRRYRRVSRDPNPIHTSRIAARAFGFARPIIHGMWTHARALAALEGRLPESFTARVQFARPILLPATVGFRAAPTDHGFEAAVTGRDGLKPFLLMEVGGAADLAP